MSTQSARRSTRKQHEPTPLLEWVLGGLGAVLFIGAVSFLFYEGLQGQDAPGGLKLRVDEVARVQGGYVVEFSAYNGGTRTLMDLHVTAHLLEGEAEIETAEAALDYLPGRSSQHGGFYLRRNPDDYRLELRAGGYQEP